MKYLVVFLIVVHAIDTTFLAVDADNRCSSWERILHTLAVPTLMYVAWWTWEALGG